MATASAPTGLMGELQTMRVNRRGVIFAIGFVASMFAVGGRWDIALAAWIAPIFLLRYVRDSSPLKGIVTIWLVSMANCTYAGIQLGNGISAAIIVINLIFGTIFAIPYVFDRLVIPRLGTIGALFVFPAAFATVEFAMGSFSPLGTAFGLRAITQTDNLPVLQLTSVLGPYSIGFIINWLATTVNWIWQNPRSEQTSRIASIYAVALALVLFGGGLRLALATSGDDYVRVAGITPDMNLQAEARAIIEGADPATTETNASPEATRAGSGLFASRDELGKVSPEVARSAHGMIHDDLLARTREAAKSGAKIVIWSETAASLFSEEEKPALLSKAAAVAREENIYLNLAIGRPFARNETIMLDPGGNIAWDYDKNYPVPGMEPVPPRQNDVPVVETPFGRLSNVICFDADFPELMRVSSDIMIVPGFDWPQIGRTHTLKMANVRSIENGYSLVRIAFNSQSAAFDQFGRVLATQDTTGAGGHVMYADVPTDGKQTLYNMTGNILAWLSVLGLAIAIVQAFRKRGDTSQ